MQNGPPVGFIVHSIVTTIFFIYGIMTIYEAIAKVRKKRNNEVLSFVNVHLSDYFMFPFLDNKAYKEEKRIYYRGIITIIVTFIYAIGGGLLLNFFNLI